MDKDHWSNYPRCGKAGAKIIGLKSQDFYDIDLGCDPLHRTWLSDKNIKRIMVRLKWFCAGAVFSLVLRLAFDILRNGRP